MNSTLRFDVDFSNVESVDNGREVVYGGSYTLDGQVKPARGDDRTTGNYLDEVMESIQAKCEQVFGELLEPDDLLDVLMGLEDGTILVDHTEAGLTVWVENNE